jgi:UDP-N-acetylmuramyl pentapeptide synthase
VAADPPRHSVWYTVNKAAVAECTGPNGKPTVAQFCAFAVLPDGRRVKSANSANNRYCDELFVEWTRDRYS